MPKYIGVAVSGGVDSAVTAHLLQQQGYKVLGLFMNLGVDNGESEETVRQICDKLGIDLRVFDVRKDFRSQVIDYFVNSYHQGYTPNPCIRCNQYIKFDLLWEKSKEAGCDRLATGHYARIVEQKKNGEAIWSLQEGKDKNKDQSYFLYTLTQEQLSITVFPLGDHEKEKVKQLAQKESLYLKKKESQDICFISGGHNDFLKEKLSEDPGPIKTKDGETIGEHQGVFFYTLGQRKGLDIGGTGPYYVVEMDIENNIVYVSQDKDDPALYSSNLAPRKVNWIKEEPRQKKFKCQAKIRYNMEKKECVVSNKGDEGWKVEFSDPIRAIAPGQSVVFYDGEEVLGGGEISSVLKDQNNSKK